MLEKHDVRCEKGILQVGMVYFAELYAAHCEEALREFGMEARGEDVGEAAGNGGNVKLASKDAAIEAGVVGWTKKVIEETTCEHEGDKGARRGRGRVIVERKNHDIFHSVLKDDKRKGHCDAGGGGGGGETRRKGETEDIKRWRGMEGRCRFIFDKAASWARRVVGRECDSDEPVGGVTLYDRVWLT